MRKLCFMLIAVLVLFCAGCGQASEPDGAVPDYNMFEDDNAPLNFNRYHALFIQEPDFDYPNTPFHYVPDSSFYDLAMDRINDIEKTYNCELEFTTTYGNGPNIYSFLRRSIFAGLDFGDYVYGSSSNYNFTSAVDGLYVPLTEVSDYIDVTDSEKYGTANLLECCMYKGVPCGVIPAAIPLKVSAACIEPIIIMNEHVIKVNNMTDPRDLLDSGSWTLDYFVEHMRDYYVADGDSKIYAMMTGNENWTVGFIGGYGCRFVFEENGDCVSVFKNPMLVNALSESIDGYHRNREYLRFGVGTIEDLYNGDVVMYNSITSEIEKVTKNVDDFGLVWFPRSSVIEDGQQVTYFSAIDTISITKSTQEPEVAAFILSKLLDPFPGYDSEGMKRSLFNTTFFDIRDVDIYLNLSKCSCFMYYAAGGYSAFSELFTIQTNVSPAELVSGKVDKLDKVIDEYIRDNYLGFVKQYIDTLS